MNWIGFKYWKTAVFPVFVTFVASLSAASAQEVVKLPLVLGQGETYESAASGLYADELYLPSADVVTTPDEAYRQLVAGNAGYLNESSDVALTTDVRGRVYPLATILYSLDMPILPTTLTQTSDRDVYLSGVTAGAVTTDDLAAVEYGVMNLQTPLLVVMGHFPSRDVTNLISKYDALSKRAYNETAKLSLSKTKTLPAGTTTQEMKLYNLVGPAIARSKEAYPDLKGNDLANVVSEALVWQSLEMILMKSTVVQDLVRSGKLEVVAAVVDDSTGRIYWLGEHPMQEEFIKPAPENLRNTQFKDEFIAQNELPEPLAPTVIQTYVDSYEANTYYDSVVEEYFVRPYYYVPSWELFSARAWTYRPWYGVWVEPFTPWPYWSPWGYPPGETGIGITIVNGHLNFFIGYNRYWGPYRSWNPHYRPTSPWWRTEIFVNPVGHWHDPIFDLIWHGSRADIHIKPYHDRPWYRPPVPGHPGRRPDIRPDDHHRPPFGPVVPGYRPGDVRPGPKPQPLGPGGIKPGVPGTRPVPGKPGTVRPFTPGKPPVRPGDVKPGNPPVRPGDVKPGNTPTRPGDVKPGNTPVRPGDVKPGNTPVRPGGVRPGNITERPDGTSRPRPIGVNMDRDIRPTRPQNTSTNTAARPAINRPTPAANRPTPSAINRPTPAPAAVNRPAPAAINRPTPAPSAANRPVPTAINRPTPAPTAVNRPTPSAINRPTPAPAAVNRPTPSAINRPAPGPAAANRPAPTPISMPRGINHVSPKGAGPALNHGAPAGPPAPGAHGGPRH
ncbi:MAG: hypothetical protein II486_12795 [Thermoguttaceae bacterium]|nr:hypothetical protein [Thermoguttaceae bacterium]